MSEANVPSDTGQDLEPWLALVEFQGRQTVATWRLEGQNLEGKQLEGQASEAIIFFTTQETANFYCTSALAGEEIKLIQPPRTELVRILISAYTQGCRFAVLDPVKLTAKRIFDLQEILTAAKAALLQERDAQE